MLSTVSGGKLLCSEFVAKFELQSRLLISV